MPSAIIVKTRQNWTVSDVSQTGGNRFGRTTKMTQKFDAELTRMLRCPITNSRLAEADASMIEILNRQIETGETVNRSGDGVKEKLECGFINENQSLIFPVRGGIVILIADQAIETNGREALERLESNP
jgi:uncharacterized protein YbaR (Trm112 family)